MIHWGWVLIAFGGGALAGVFGIALAISANLGDQQPKPATMKED